ncbi:hypothetical protein HS99_0026540 [Kitasatospora aureofaciens]|uniref:Uncharacterized protein n=1 Tax=Kitasatospora aureofaciens TaxID=1894 RepID=A0A1E7NA51_KITAU|nr:hypothetical protein HS99_0026540 [Kitasatospora aureofaciens]GGU83587.1 hypothetical protein GCM10010502_39620 [Kitasatospora aureofaciens]
MPRKLPETPGSRAQLAAGAGLLDELDELEALDELEGPEALDEPDVVDDVEEPADEPTELLEDERLSVR